MNVFSAFLSRYARFQQADSAAFVSSPTEDADLFELVSSGLSLCLGTYFNYLPQTTVERYKRCEWWLHYPKRRLGFLCGCFCGFRASHCLFFQLLWINFLHSAVYDFLPQVLISDARILCRFVNGQARNDVERCAN